MEPDWIVRADIRKVLEEYLEGDLLNEAVRVVMQVVEHHRAKGPEQAV